MPHIALNSPGQVHLSPHGVFLNTSHVVETLPVTHHTLPSLTELQPKRPLQAFNPPSLFLSRSFGSFSPSYLRHSSQIITCLGP